MIVFFNSSATMKTFRPIRLYKSEWKGEITFSLFRVDLASAQRSLKLKRRHKLKYLNNLNTNCPSRVDLASPPFLFRAALRLSCENDLRASSSARIDIGTGTIVNSTTQVSPESRRSPSLCTVKLTVQCKHEVHTHCMGEVFLPPPCFPGQIKRIQ